MAEAQRLTHLAFGEQAAPDEQVAVHARDRWRDVPGRPHVTPDVGEGDADVLRGRGLRGGGAVGLAWEGRHLGTIARHQARRRRIGARIPGTGGTPCHGQSDVRPVAFGDPARPRRLRPAVTEPTTEAIRGALRIVSTGGVLTPDDAERFMGAVLDGEVTPAQLGGLLIGMHARGETAGELAGFVRAMRSRALAVDAPEGTIDTCGTGGDVRGTFNISTAMALVVAAAGVPVAKAGNRAVSSQAGSSDVMAALGLRVEQTPEEAELSLRKDGFAYLHAPAFHPGMRHAGPVRRELGVRTAFNLFGPLANPARPRRQLVGVPDAEAAPRVAAALLELGHGARLRGPRRPAGRAAARRQRRHLRRLAGGHRRRQVGHDDDGLPRRRPRRLRGGEPGQQRGAHPGHPRGPRAGPGARRRGAQRRRLARGGRARRRPARRGGAGGRRPSPRAPRASGWSGCAAAPPARPNGSRMTPRGRPATAHGACRHGRVAMPPRTDAGRAPSRIRAARDRRPPAPPTSPPSWATATCRDPPRGAATGPARRDVVGRLARPGLHLIAEIKRRSPSAGPLRRRDLDVAARARAYQAGGASIDLRARRAPLVRRLARGPAGRPGRHHAAGAGQGVRGRCPPAAAAARRGRGRRAAAGGAPSAPRRSPASSRWRSSWAWSRSSRRTTRGSCAPRSAPTPGSSASTTATCARSRWTPSRPCGCAPLVPDDRLVVAESACATRPPCAAGGRSASTPRSSARSSCAPGSDPAAVEARVAALVAAGAVPAPGRGPGRGRPRALRQDLRHHRAGRPARRHGGRRGRHRPQLRARHAAALDEQEAAALVAAARAGRRPRQRPAARRRLRRPTRLARWRPSPRASAWTPCSSTAHETPGDLDRIPLPVLKVLHVPAAAARHDAPRADAPEPTTRPTLPPTRPRGRPRGRGGALPRAGQPAGHPAGHRDTRRARRHRPARGP